MILPDMYVVSEPLRGSPDVGVIECIDAQPLGTLLLSTGPVAEPRFGAAILPAGRPQQLLNDSIETETVPRFTDRIVSFDPPAAETHATIIADAPRCETPNGVAEGFIAAIAAATGMSVATRDVASFQAFGLSVIDPWRA